MQIIFQIKKYSVLPVFISKDSQNIVNFLHDRVYFILIVPEEIHHVVNIHTYYIKPYKKWLFHNLPSNYLQILSTANFVSIWRKIIGTQHQILYFNPLYTERVRGQWLPYKYHSFFLECKHCIPFY